MTRRLWKDGRFQTDPWRFVEAGQDVPPAGSVILPLDWWLAQRAASEGTAARIGVELEPAADVTALAGDLARFALIVLRFPSFADGRAFSMAALLRQRHGFAGNLRAAGDVLVDQIGFMLRCGFDEFEIANPATLRALEQGSVPGQDIFYQPASGDAPASGFAWRRRQGIQTG